jgi:IS30 family transposase
LSIVERVTRFTIIVKLEGGTKKAIKDAITRELSSYKVESITSDNGSEFAGMAEIGKIL